MMDERLILATGASGQLGRSLARLELPLGWRIVATDRSQLDLMDTDALSACVRNGHEGRLWSAVINAAAYTAVDDAENDMLTAWAINALAPAALGQACAEADIPIVQISTDYVFDGKKTRPWNVNDEPNPLGVYGASKLAGEMAIKTSGAHFAIIRTAWVFSEHGSNFVKSMLSAAAKNKVLRVVDDQIGNPTSASDLAYVAAQIAMQLSEAPSISSGVYHFSNSETASWASFAEEIFRQSLKRGGPVAEIDRIPTKEYPTLARRPANSALDHNRITEAFGVKPRRWPEALEEIMDILIGVTK